MSTVIRKLEKNDAVAVEALINAAGPFVSARSLSDYWLYSALFADTCLVAEAQDRMEGVIVAFLDQTQALRDCYIQDVAVHPDARGKGVGADLMEALLDVLAQRSCRRVWLTSEPGNDVAITLWGRFGFTNPVADFQKDGFWVTRDLKGPGKDRVIFEKTVR